MLLDTSTSIFFVKLPIFLAAFSASSIVITAIQFSLIIIASERPYLWLSPPPYLTAFFSNSLNPGVVFLVQATLTPLARFTHLAVNVAIPLILHRKLRDNLSACSISLTGPHIFTITSPDCNKSPSLSFEFDSSPK